MTRITMGGWVHTAKPSREGWPPITRCGLMGEHYHESVLPEDCPTCKRIAREAKMNKRGWIGQRVRYLANSEPTFGVVIALLEDGRLVIAWDDGYIDDDYGNTYDCNEVMCIESER